jgi:hypothetical protein
MVDLGFRAMALRISSLDADMGGSQAPRPVQKEEIWAALWNCEIACGRPFRVRGGLFSAHGRWHSRLIPPQVSRRRAQA